MGRISHRFGLVVRCPLDDSGRRAALAELKPRQIETVANNAEADPRLRRMARRRLGWAEDDDGVRIIADDPTAARAALRRALPLVGELHRESRGKVRAFTVGSLSDRLVAMDHETMMANASAGRSRRPFVARDGLLVAATWAHEIEGAAPPGDGEVLVAVKLPLGGGESRAYVPAAQVEAAT